MRADLRRGPDRDIVAGRPRGADLRHRHRGEDQAINPTYAEGWESERSNATDGLTYDCFLTARDDFV